ncbi:MAG TPA: hypothetical protein VJ953_20705 [Saprospiraceae bacterium]|nr:hypothetical protein [Saprospiraceae bacterium]
MKTIALQNIQLSPVLRFYPDELTGKHYPYGPDFGIEEQAQFWQAQLAAVGLGGLTAVKKGSELVYSNSIPDEQLGVLLKWFLERWYGEEWGQLSSAEWVTELEEQGFPASFEGGIVLTAADQLIVAPQCCVSLQDHAEWPRKPDGQDFQRIWIGHPWMYYKVDDNRVLLTGLIEKELNGDRWLHYKMPDNDRMMDASHFRAKASEQIDEQDIKYAIDLVEWQRAIHELEAALDDFRQRLMLHLVPFVSAYTQKMAACLVDGNGEALSYSPEDI